MEKTRRSRRPKARGIPISTLEMRLSDKSFYSEHLNDPNFDLTRRPRRVSAEPTFEMEFKGAELDGGSVIDLSDTESHLESSRHTSSISSINLQFDNDSPYPEVRAAVPSTDDPTIPVNTFRMWFLGVIFSVLIPGLNQFFSTRNPSVVITAIVIQLLVLPIGRGLARVLPHTRFRTFGRTWSLNPGPFNVKEHVCITTMANVAIFGSYISDVFATQRVFYHQSLTLGYQLTLVIGNQFLGFSLGGILRHLVVWPGAMIWPGALVNAALFNTFHRTLQIPHQRSISRERFLIYCVLASFVWYWIPGYLFTALSMFNWICWIAPKNATINALFGTVSGLGMSTLTLDWTVVTLIGSPLITPWWAVMNSIMGTIIFVWILAPIFYFKNFLYTAYFPISTSASFTNTGEPYEPTAIVTDSTFNVEKYRAYSPVYLSAVGIISLGLRFAAFSALVVHTLLWFRKDIYKRLQSTLDNERDLHARLMSVYREVPQYWYILTGVISLSLLLVGIHLFPTQLPVWGVLVAFIIAALLSVPLAIVQAITSQSIPLNIMFELVGGYVVPGRPVAVVIFKAISFSTTFQAVSFAANLKLGHYMKIPPRTMFTIQMVASMLCCFTITFVQSWMFSNIEDFCSKTQKNGFTCPGTNSFASSSLVWGGIGPARLFSPGQKYSFLLYFFLIGAVIPVPFYFLAHRWPLSFWRYFNAPIFFSSCAALPAVGGINLNSWGLVGFVFNYLVRRYRIRWWIRYNYILSAGLDAGVAIGMVVIFFTVVYPRGGSVVNWWGNSVWLKTADANGTPLKVLQPGETFGPKVWF